VSSCLRSLLDEKATAMKGITMNDAHHDRFPRVLASVDPDTEARTQTVIDLASDSRSVLVRLASLSAFTIGLYDENLDVLIDTVRHGQRCAVVAWHAQRGRVLLNAHPVDPAQTEGQGPMELELQLDDTRRLRLQFPVDETERLTDALTEARARLRVS
jgi:hypothetical protein